LATLNLLHIIKVIESSYKRNIKNVSKTCKCIFVKYATEIAVNFKSELSKS